jgi:hypothetical protein
VPFSVEPLAAEGRVRLAVVVGTGPAAGLRGARVRRPPSQRQVLDPRERADRMRRADQLEADALARLESPDPRDRIEGVEWADVGTVMGYEALLERLVNDPDPRVRAAAAEGLGGGDVGAVRPLLAALGDSEPQVVISVLESLETLGDASIIPDLTFLLEHPDPTVRERGKDAIEFLE